MIQGATMRRASAIRMPAETATIAASHSYGGTGTARARTAAAALAARFGRRPARTCPAPGTVTERVRERAGRVKTPALRLAASDMSGGRHRHASVTNDPQAQATRPAD